MALRISYLRCSTTALTESGTAIDLRFLVCDSRLIEKSRATFRLNRLWLRLLQEQA
jgi:hypothetical protein